MHLKLSCFLLVTALLCRSPNIAKSNEPNLVSLNDWAQANPDGEELYPATRCTALFNIILSLAANNLPKDIDERYTAAMNQFYLVAVSRQAELGSITLEQSSERVIETVKAIRNIYEERVTTNYAKTGQNWGQDSLMVDDLRFCGEFLGRFR